MFYLHEKGPGSQWAQQLRIGDKVKLIGPGGRMKYRQNAPVHIMYGDETALGLFQCLIREANSSNAHFYCLTDLGNSNKNWVTLANINATVNKVHATHPALEAKYRFSEWLDQQDYPKEDMAFYLAGNARSIQAFKTKTLSLGFNSKQIQSDPYWAEGKCGL